MKKFLRIITGNWKTLASGILAVFAISAVSKSSFDRGIDSINIMYRNAAKSRPDTTIGEFFEVQ